MDRLADILLFLIPPKDHTGRPFKRWQWSVAMSLFALLIAAILASGFVPTIYNGVANAGDVKELRIDILERDLLDARVKQCREPPGSRLREEYGIQVTKIQRQIMELTGAFPPIINCNEM